MLTPRQKEIAGLVAKRLSRRAIAERVGLSEETVKQHISEAAHRIGGEGRARERIICWFFTLESSQTNDAA